MRRVVTGRYERQADEKLHASRNALTLQLIHGFSVGLTVGLTVQTPGIAIDDLDVFGCPAWRCNGLFALWRGIRDAAGRMTTSRPSQEHAQQRLDLST
jgi:hypothetical protein